MGIKRILKCILPHGFVMYWQTSRFKGERPIDAWYRDRGDETLRLDYNELTEHSIVFDCGGYKGSWASDIFSKYCCNIYIFEIVSEYAKNIQDRFAKNPKIKIYPFGLGNANEQIDVSISNDGSSTTRTVGSVSESVEIKRFSDFIEENNIKGIDLIKINIEGSEYDLLDHMIDSGKIDIIKNLQIQFHNFFPDAETRRRSIQEKLKRTHIQNWNYEFIWENWKLKA